MRSVKQTKFWYILGSPKTKQLGYQVKHLLIILSLLLLTSNLFGQSERPETIVIPVGTLGDISDSRKQIIQNTLSQELTKFCLSTFSQRGDLTRKTFSVSPEYKLKYCLCFLKKVIWQHGFVALPDCWFQTRQRLVC